MRQNRGSKKARQDGQLHPLSRFFAVLLMFSSGKIKRYSVALYYPLSTDLISIG
jgi:hypothetical protein